MASTPCDLLMFCDTQTDQTWFLTTYTLTTTDTGRNIKIWQRDRKSEYDYWFGFIIQYQIIIIILNIYQNVHYWKVWLTDWIAELKYIPKQFNDYFTRTRDLTRQFTQLFTGPEVASPVKISPIFPHSESFFLEKILWIEL